MCTPGETLNFASNTQVSVLNIRGSKIGPAFIATVETKSDVSQLLLVEKLLTDVEKFANLINGVKDGATVIVYITPRIVQHTSQFKFLNLESLLVFVQTVPFQKKTSSITSNIDMLSLVALI